MKSTPIIVTSGNGAKALPAGVRILKRGGRALDAVEACARIVEADPTDTSVGRGGKPNVLGIVELDASIVDGTAHRVGAVAALRGYLYPISVARAVMEHLPHVMLVGDGAALFAKEIGAERAQLLTPSTRRLWIERLKRARETPSTLRRRRALAEVVRKTVPEERGGTVNFIAIDRRGDIASAVTTSGWAYKYPGRVGDSPIIGAGNYCDSRYGGATCTGFGELAIRSVTAKTAVDRLASGSKAGAVARAAIADANALDHESAFNIVVLAADGTHASATNRAGRQYAFMTIEMDEPTTKLRAVVTPARERVSSRAFSPGRRSTRAR